MSTEQQLPKVEVAGDPTTPGLANKSTESAENDLKGDVLKVGGDAAGLKVASDIGLMSEEQLAAMSPQDLEAMFGLQMNDRSLAPRAEGDAPAHVIDAQLEAGVVRERTEAEALARATAAPAAPPAQVATAAPATPPAQVATAAAPAAPAAAPTTAAAAPAATPELLGRNGQRIPYSVLEGERAKSARTEAENARIAAENERLKQQLAAAQSAGASAAAAATAAAPAGERREVATAAAAAVKGALTDEQLQQLAETLPAALVDALRAQNDTIKSIAAQAAEAAEFARRQQLSEADRAKQEVMDIIDADEVLSGWRLNPDQTMWKKAVALDATLAANPEFAGMTTVERFDAVKRALGVMPAAPVDAEAARLQQQAAARLAEATRVANGGGAPVPFTHSDMRGGTPPAQSEQSRLDGMDAATLGARVDKMSDADIAKMLANL